jgi:hypothetical protein
MNFENFFAKCPAKAEFYFVKKLKYQLLTVKNLIYNFR